MSDETEMVAKMFDRVIAERDAARAQVAKLTQERNEARAAAQAMSRPVSDEVWIKHSVMMSGLRVAGKDSVDALIAARVRDSKEKTNGV